MSGRGSRGVVVGERDAAVEVGTGTAVGAEGDRLVRLGMTLGKGESKMTRRGPKSRALVAAGLAIVASMALVGGAAGSPEQARRAKSHHEICVPGAEARGFRHDVRGSIQGHRELRHDVRELRRDRRELRRDLREIRQDRRELRRDLRELRQDRREFRRDIRDRRGGRRSWRC